MFCQACGAQIAEEARFCPRCGKSALAPPTQAAHPHAVPHRGGTVLALGILGLVLCFICGMIAWSMGNNDLREMEAGRMDPSGMSLTKAGRICGMISSIIVLAGAAFYVLIIIVGVLL